MPNQHILRGHRIHIWLTAGIGVLLGAMGGVGLSCWHLQQRSSMAARTPDTQSNRSATRNFLPGQRRSLPSPSGAHRNHTKNVAILAVVRNAKGQLFIAGNFWGSARFGSLALQARGASELFVAQVHPNGKIQWLATWQGTSRKVTPVPAALALDRAGQLYVIGKMTRLRSAQNKASSNRRSLCLVTGCPTFKTAGPARVFVAQLNPQGRWRWIRSSFSLLHQGLSL